VTLACRCPPFDAKWLQIAAVGLLLGYPNLPVFAQSTQPATAPAANSASLGLSGGSGPIEVNSDDSLELQQSNKVYVARGNAIAKRGDRTLYGDVLMAYYRDIPNSSDTEIWRIIDDGHVKITTPTESVEGDHGVYDLDTKYVIVTGAHLKMTTPRDVVTARDSMEWYDDKQVGVARGDAVAVREDRRIRADVLTSQISTAPGEASRISRVDGLGHVIVSRPGEVGTGDKAIYNVDTGLVTLFGHVTLARGQNTLVGDYGVLDLETGMSRLLPRPGTAADLTRTRVQGLIVPKKKDQPDAKKPPAATGSADAAQKTQPDDAKAR